MTLDELRNGPELPWGLHDAYLVRFGVDWDRREIAFELRVQIGEHQESDRLGRVTLRGMEYFAVSPHRPNPSDYPPKGELPWIDVGSGALDDEARAELRPVPEGCFLSHLYTREPFQVFHLCARGAALEWLEPAPVPSKDGRRAFFAGGEIPDPKPP